MVESNSLDELVEAVIVNMEYVYDQDRGMWVYQVDSDYNTFMTPSHHHGTRLQAAQELVEQIERYHEIEEIL